jgi:hypothetical protein
MEKEEQRLVVKFLWLKGWGSKEIHQGLMSTLGDDAYGLSQVKIWLQRFGTGYLSCSDLPHAGRPPLILGRRVEVFVQKDPFSSVRIIAKSLLTTVSIVKEIFQSENWG